mmetsp:Transcript_39573/g.112231  ORF Transcript_39573/g.112231 Transcript_39573/m.112231 type:complete len:360 (+) Transcript_39573:788-1867(+)|eukprot:CAMPEP_0117659184 /NCGR_PEP_ID=MMETSP0804-20121206/6290_1 /TAXON_ID=1074897 /ORGANISM="Tetraselmis astigmatica, Strain CCMP880" /LENGTH=359 /DNA_ID=CAMNT_0005465811 /DNA_START=711 /DNA_END=1790 /DNA_ORIENTATION=-
MGGRNKRLKRGTEGSQSPGALPQAAAAPTIEEDVWAQCEICNKWRRLPPGSVVEEETPWYCHMNGDKARNRCDIAEEEYSDTEYVEEASDGNRSLQASKASRKKRGAVGNGGGKPPTGLGKQQLPSGKGKGKQHVKGSTQPVRHPSSLGPTVLRQHHKTLSVALGNSSKWPAGPSTGQTASRITLDLWRSMHAIAPEASNAAAAATNASTSAGYFKDRSPEGAKLASQAEHLSWAAVLGGTAVAHALAGKYILESPRPPQRTSSSQPAANPPVALPLPEPVAGLHSASTATPVGTGNHPQQQQQQEKQPAPGPILPAGPLAPRMVAATIPPVTPYAPAASSLPPSADAPAERQQHHQLG